MTGGQSGGEPAAQACVAKAFEPRLNNDRVRIMSHPETPPRESKKPSLTEHEEVGLMRDLRRRRRADDVNVTGELTFGERVADRVATVVGSWRFIIIQSGFLLLWIILNTVGWIKAWDPYPFILMNLALSFQAAYTAPLIMMSQNRQEDIDRRNALYDFEVNLKAEHEIKALHNKINLLHEKLDRLRDQDMAEITQLVRELRREQRGDSS